MNIKYQPHAERMRISGYASLFGKKDLGGDIVRRGAFSGSLLSLKNGRIPMLFAHETKEPIGVWHRMFEDATGLFVSGDIFFGEPRADHMRAWCVAVLSVVCLSATALPEAAH